MRRYPYIIAILCMTLASCADVNEQPESMESTAQPIIHGSPAKDEPYTVALMEIPGELSPCEPLMEGWCHSIGQECIEFNGKEDCTTACTAPIPPSCSKVQNHYEVTAYDCVDFYGTKYHVPRNTTCATGCNAAKTDCNSDGPLIYEPCDDEYLTEECEFYGGLCMMDDHSYYCTKECNQPGTTQISCGKEEEDYCPCTGEYVYYEERTHCKSVWFDGKKRNLTTSDMDWCYWGCTEGVGCDDPEKDIPYTTEPGTVSADTFCTGTLIHPQWVLTAAHCVVDTDPYGGHHEAENLRRMRVGIGEDQRAMHAYLPDHNRIFPHEHYTDDDSGIYNDLALIRLRAPIPASTAKPVPPLPPWLAFNSSVLPQNMKTSGYGLDENSLSGRRLTTTMPTTAYCGKYNPNDGPECSVGYVYLHGCHPNRLMCAMHGTGDGISGELTIPYGTFYTPKGSKGEMHSQGDSGGPTYYTVGNIRYVAGVTSYGDAFSNTYNVSTSVADFYDWIIQKAPEVASQYVEICDNGVDDDGNGLVDQKDKACQAAPKCGNGKLDNGEPCDGSLFTNNQTTCAAWNSQYTSGNVSCNANCTINYSACTSSQVPECGNGRLDAGEQCDGKLFVDNKTTCAEWDDKYISGKARCSKKCKLNFSACVEKPVCGNGRLDDGELCDGNIIKNNKTACAAWDSQYISGNVTCNADCTLSYSACITSQAPECGNGRLEAGEQCDGKLFVDNKTTCAEWDDKYISGKARCSKKCRLNFSACVEKPVCGNGILEPGEQCDGDVFLEDKTTCNAWDNQYNAGDVSCNADCTIDYKACTTPPVCGNHRVEDGEMCDGETFRDNKANCSDWDDQYFPGKVSCTKDCTIDTGDCIKIVIKELCDNALDDDHNGLTDCADPACFDTDECRDVPQQFTDDGVVHVDEHPDCSVAPAGSGHTSPYALLFGMIGLVGWIYRRRILR